MEMLMDVLMESYQNPDLSAHAVLKGLDSMSFEEMEEFLGAHVRLAEEFDGLEPGSLPVGFKIVRDHELVTPTLEYLRRLLPNNVKI